MTPEKIATICGLMRINSQLSREVARLIFVEGKNRAEAARITGLTPAGARNVAQRIERWIERAEKVFPL
ncbi:MAG: transcriptional regulator KorA [Azoarcus sp.]|jgi:hypothetical protein|nr:transcriptional regulator KorA [Azoarcus sp.]